MVDAAVRDENGRRRTMPRVDLAIALDDGMLIIVVVLYDGVVDWVRSAWYVSNFDVTV